MKWICFLLVGLFASTALADTRRYDITIKRLNTAEQQLLHEHKKTIGLKQFEIERQIQEIRKQRLEIERLRTQAARTRANTAAEYSRARQTRRSTAARRYTPAVVEPDWKTVETPDVTVKGTFREGDRMAALVSGGKTVHENEVFSTTYRGELKYWKVMEITQHDAYFQQVERDGSPWKPKQPAVEVDEGKSPSFISRVWALMR